MLRFIITDIYTHTERKREREREREKGGGVHTGGNYLLLFR